MRPFKYVWPLKPQNGCCQAVLYHYSFPIYLIIALIIESWISWWTEKNVWGCGAFFWWKFCLCRAEKVACWSNWPQESVKPRTSVTETDRIESCRDSAINSKNSERQVLFFLFLFLSVSCLIVIILVCLTGWLSYDRTWPAWNLIASNLRWIQPRDTLLCVVILMKALTEICRE